MPHPEFGPMVMACPSVKINQDVTRKKLVNESKKRKFLEHLNSFIVVIFFTAPVFYFCLYVKAIQQF
ncbi:MAG: hypothetical protein WC239_12430, partial [Sphaerochaetaceae bacterium]